MSEKINTVSGKEGQDKKYGGNKNTGNTKIDAVRDSVKNQVRDIHQK